MTKLKALERRIRVLEDKFKAFQHGAQAQMDRDRFAWDSERIEQENLALRVLRAPLRVQVINDAEANLCKVPKILPAEKERRRRARAKAEGDGSGAGED